MTEGTTAMTPKPEDYDFDLVSVLKSIVGVTTTVHEDALTADVLGTERAGNGVLIGDGLVLTIGYLVTEAETVWLSLSDGTTVAGHVLGYDQETGFGLIQALGRIGLQPIKLGDSDDIQVGSPVVVCGTGGLSHAVAAHVVTRQEFAGYWEYVLDSAIFTAPAHPQWGGAAVVSKTGELVGIGSLQVQDNEDSDQEAGMNIVFLFNLLKPILDDLLTIGQTKNPPRPWLGIYVTEVSDNIVIVGVAEHGPNEDSDVQSGDIILAVDNQDVPNLAGFFRSVWAMGQAGTDIPLQVHRNGQTLDITIKSADRRKLLRQPVVH